MSRPLIMHVIDSLGRGGAEVLLVNTLPLLQPYFRQIIVISIPDNDFEADIAPDIPIICLHQKNVRHFWQTAHRLHQYIKQYKPDLIHSHLYWSSIIARLACPRRIPLIYTIHATNYFDKLRITVLLERLVCRKRHHLIAVSQAAMRAYADKVPIKGKCDVLYNFINPAFFNDYIPTPRVYTSQSPLRLVAVGNLKLARNHLLLVEALRLLRGKPVVIDVYGEGSLRAMLEAAIDKYQVPLYLKGQHKNIAAVLPLYEGFVNPAFEEGLSLGALEAMASGLPLLLSDLESVRETAHDNALYFSPYDAQSLAQQIEMLLNQQIDTTASAKIAKQYAAQIAGKETYREKLLAIYQHYVSSL